MVFPPRGPFFLVTAICMYFPPCNFLVLYRITPPLAFSILVGMMVAYNYKDRCNICIGIFFTGRGLRVLVLSTFMLNAPRNWFAVGDQMSEQNPYSKKMKKENVEAITNPDIDENLKDVVPDTPKNSVKPKITVPNTRIPNQDQDA